MSSALNLNTLPTKISHTSTDPMIVFNFLSPPYLTISLLNGTEVVTEVGSLRTANLSSSTCSASKSRSKETFIVSLPRLHMPCKPNSFKVRTLIRIGQLSLNHTLETLRIDICCVSETRIQDLRSATR